VLDACLSVCLLQQSLTIGVKVIEQDFSTYARTVIREMNPVGLTTKTLDTSLASFLSDG
jgi:hypothetical protein